MSAVTTSRPARSPRSGSTLPAATRSRAIREPLVSRTSAMLVMAVFTVYFLLPL